MAKQLTQTAPQCPAPVTDLVCAVAARSDRVLCICADSAELPQQLSNLGFDNLTHHTLTTMPHAADHFDVVIVLAPVAQVMGKGKFISSVKHVLRPAGHALFLMLYQPAATDDDLRWFLGRYFDIVSLTQVPDTKTATNMICVHGQKVPQTAGFWDLVTRQRKF